MNDGDSDASPSDVNDQQSENNLNVDLSENNSLLAPSPLVPPQMKLYIEPQLKNAY